MVNYQKWGQLLLKSGKWSIIIFCLSAVFLGLVLHNGLTLGPPQLVFPKITISRDEGSDWLRANRHKGLG